MSKRRKISAPARPSKVRDVFVARPFEGMIDEVDWVALRELVPAASASARLPAEVSDRPVTLATVLPMAAPAIVKPDGRIMLGLQRSTQSGDVSRDLGSALIRAVESEPGSQVVPLPSGDGPRLQDLLVPGPLEVTVWDGFDFWLDGDVGDDPNVKASLERANAAVYPTARLRSAKAAYWCRIGERVHLRWVLPDDEDRALDALARLAAADALRMAEGVRFAGILRAHGLLVPVWDLPGSAGAADCEPWLAEVAVRYAEALANDAALGSAERRSRQGLLGRQFTLR